MKVISERQRILQPVTFAASTTLTRDLPRDTVLKALQLRLSGSVVTTFASGTPVADAQSTFDNLVSRIDIVVNGSRVVKNVRPHLMAMQQLLAMAVSNERKASAGASAAAGNNPTADSGFVFGTTGQVTTVAESLLIPFENILALKGREGTWLNLKGVASAEIRFSTQAFASLQGFGNTAPVAYSSSTFQIDITTIEAQDVAPNVFFSDFKQTTKQQLIAGQVTGLAIDINRGNKLQGIMMFAQDGAAGSATTATGKLASNLLVDSINLKINGQVDVKATNFLALQAENRNRFGVNAGYSSNVSRLDGIAYLDMLRGGDISTALPVMPPDVDQVQLIVSTRDSSTVSYTNACSLTLMTNEIVSPQS